MNAFMRILSTIVAWGDSSSSNNNPRLKFVDWTRDNASLAVQNPQSQPFTLAPGEERLVFDGTRALTADGTTEMSVSLVSGTTDRYRFRHTAGTAPGFRTDRGLDLSGSTFDVVVNANGTALISRTAGAGTFAGVLAGDIFWIPDSTEAPSQPFQAANQGFWVVMAVTSTTVTLGRDGDFEAANETGIAVTTAAQMRAFSATGVQVGDKLRVTAGFVASTRRTFTIEAVTSQYLEVSSSAAVAAETGILPGAAGLTVYTAAKRVVHIEADQEAAVKVNGDTGESQLLSPWVAASPRDAAVYQRVGPTWSLSVLNKSSVPMSLLVISAE